MHTDPDRTSAAEQVSPSQFSARARASAPDTREDLKLAADTAYAASRREKGPEVEEGSEQVRKTGNRPRPKPPAPLDVAGTRQSHNADKAADAQRVQVEPTREQRKLERKEEFRRRAAGQKLQERVQERDGGISL